MKITTTQYTKAMDTLPKGDLSRFYGNPFTPEFYVVSDAIDSMTNEERRIFKEKLLAANEQRIMQNLAYNYQTQEWV